MRRPDPLDKAINLLASLDSEANLWTACLELLHLDQGSRSRCCMVIVIHSRLVPLSPLTFRLILYSRTLLLDPFMVLA